jgi:hypothetical protein
MKKFLLLSFALLFSTAVLAQDACAELMKFNDYKKNVNRTYRMTSKMEKMGQTQIMEKDKAGNVHQTMTMSMMGQNMKVESVIIGKTIYTKKNDEAWEVQQMDSTQIDNIKSQWQNGQLQFFKNCQKLPNEGDYKVYSGDFDPEKMTELMSKSSKPMPNAEVMKQMEMKMTFYINSKDDLEKMKLNMNMMGQSFESDMVYEYDIPVTVETPNVKK